MIISHKHRFIFIKTEKTAGTSIEIALSEFCGPDDVITPVGPEDEILRKELGFRGPQNYTIPYRQYTILDFMRLIFRNKRRYFYNHARASFIMKYVDRETWNSYFKFCFERNPWDKTVSLYYFRYKAEPRPPMSDFIRSRRLRNVRGMNLYTRRSRIVVDRVFKYEDMGSAMEEIRDRLGLKQTPRLPFAKTGHRVDKRSYREILSEGERDEIARIFAREIAIFDYQW